MSQSLLIAALLVAEPSTPPPESTVPCPAAKDLPQLAISKIEDPAVPVIDHWQVFWDDVPLSDAQVALLAKDEALIEMTREEMEDRGTWVYIGLGTAAAGTAVSSAVCV